MSFSSSIPDKVQENPNVSAFVSILDALQNFKTEIIADSLRVDNAAVLMDRKWLLKKLSEFGISDIPLGYPIQIIRQYLLNVDTVCRTRGSKIGTELYCSLLSFGEVSVDDSSFYVDPEILLLDSLSTGYITDDNSELFFYLTDDTDNIRSKSSLKITVKSKYFNGNYPAEESLIKGYLQSTIRRNIGFSGSDVIFDWEGRSDFYFHELLNPYFI